MDLSLGRSAPNCGLLLLLLVKLQASALLKVTLLHGCFSRFLKCTNGTKSRKVSHIY